MAKIKVLAIFKFKISPQDTDNIEYMFFNQNGNPKKILER